MVQLGFFPISCLPSEIGCGGSSRLYQWPFPWDIFKSFKSAIDERNKEQETLIIDLKSIKENKITKATINKTSIKLNVTFETFQLRALMDKNDQIIDGDTENEILVKDEWVFEKKINDNTPNWTLVETRSN